jgi:SAM-dependent methyltransferase
MSYRPCPFCSSESSTRFAISDGVWVKCKACRSVFQDITADAFEHFHGEAFQDSGFTDVFVAARGLEPTSALWKELSLPGTSLLEIGPGSGHFLAAAHKAGRSVTAVESSEYHRTFIREAWGIESVYPDFSAIPKGQTFDAIVSINVLEHVYDVVGFLESMAGVLAPDGVIFISTVNAVSLEASFLRTRWAMCKPPDHVSFPSPKGMVQAARATGLRPERVWSTELPFEFPISTLVAARDWAKARHDRGCAASDSGSVGTLNAASKARLARFTAMSTRFDPTSRMLGALGRAATVKALLRPDRTLAARG